MNGSGELRFCHDSTSGLRAFAIKCADMEPREAMVALNMSEHVGPVRVRQMLEFFGDAPSILRASRQQLMQVRGIGEEAAEAISKWEQKIDLKAEFKRIEEFGCHVVIGTDEEYPALLREIYDPPIVLYVKGKLTAKDKNAVALVGSRMTTHYGIEVARKLGYQLAYLGVTVVSGGARGVGHGNKSRFSGRECGTVRTHRRERGDHNAVSI
jgi:DNA processing protein